MISEENREMNEETMIYIYGPIWNGLLDRILNTDPWRKISDWFSREKIHSLLGEKLGSKVHVHDWHLSSTMKWMRVEHTNDE